MTRRRLAAALAATLLALSFVAVASPASACACGAPTPPDGTSVSVGEERAIVTFDGTTERIELLLDMLADGADTGLILPTPTPATVTLGDRALFEAIARQTEPVVETRYDWWGTVGVGDAGAAPPTVLAVVDLGPVRAVTLAASDADGLRAWLDDNGYGIDDEVLALLDDYVARGWSFAALSLTGEEPLDGELDPIRFEFASDEAVYPLLLSQGADIPQTVTLYLFGDDGMSARFADGTALGTVRWAGAVEEPELAPLGDYLTVVDGYFADPATQITSDVLLTPTGERADVSPVEVRTEYVQLGGIPLGIVLVAVGILIALMAAASLLSARRR